MRLLCTGDLHLGAHPEYGAKPGDRLRDQAHVLEQIATIAFREKVDMILNAGDTFDGPAVPPEQLDVYARFVAACDAMDIPVVAITGNGKHDAAMRDVDGMQIFNRIPGITVASTPTVIPYDGVTIACLPWVHPGRLVAAEGGGDRDEINCRASELLVAIARGLRDQAPTDRPCVLMLHGSVGLASLPAGLATDELREPVIPFHDLAELGFTCIVCAHIHVPQFAPRDVDGYPLGWLQPQHDGDACSGAAMLYTGSPMPLNFGEANVPHGVWIVDLDDQYEHGVRAEFFPITSPPFVTIDVDVAAGGDVFAADPHNLIIDAIDDSDVGGAVVRLRYLATASQQRTIDPGMLRLVLLEDGARMVKVEPTIVREDRARAAGVDENLAPLAALDMYLDANEIPADQADRMRARTALYLERVS
jgi:DNA repair exonuclease SbcCD nuclease subunit